MRLKSGNQKLFSTSLDYHSTDAIYARPRAFRLVGAEYPFWSRGRTPFARDLKRRRVANSDSKSCFLINDNISCGRRAKHCARELGSGTFGAWCSRIGRSPGSGIPDRTFED